MLRYRLLSALIVVSLAFGFVALDGLWPIHADCHGVWMSALAVFLMFGSAMECTILLRHRPVPFDARPALFGTASIMAASLVPMLWPLSGEPYPADCALTPLGWPLAAVVIALAGCFAWIIPTYKSGAGALEQAVLSGWLAAYFGGTFAFWLAVRRLGPEPWGLVAVVGMIMVIKFADAGAYFAGRTLGKRKLSPTVSPGKTVEGLIGGMVIASLVSWLYFSLFVPRFYGDKWVDTNWVGAIVLGVALTIAGLLGDLLESIVKRESGCKDSAQFFPGLGGMWDVTDSLLPAGLVGYLILTADLLGHPR